MKNEVATIDVAGLHTEVRRVQSLAYALGQIVKADQGGAAIVSTADKAIGALRDIKRIIGEPCPQPDYMKHGHTRKAQDLNIPRANEDSARIKGLRQDLDSLRSLHSIVGQRLDSHLSRLERLELKTEHLRVDQNTGPQQFDDRRYGEKIDRMADAGLVGRVEALEQALVRVTSSLSGRVTKDMAERYLHALEELAVAKEEPTDAE